MEEIELSVMQHTADPALTANVLQPLLDQFKAQAHVQVHLQCLDWVTDRQELTKMALYHHGPDVSEIGSSLVSEPIAMNAVRPFTPWELAKIGKPPRLDRVEVSRHHNGKYRVNIWQQTEPDKNIAITTGLAAACAAIGRSHAHRL